VFEKKESERMPMRKAWDHVIDLRRVCAKERKDISVVKSRERGGTGVCEGSVEEGVH